MAGMKARPGRLLILAWMILVCREAPADGGFVRQSRSDPRIIDLSDEVMRTCNRSLDRRLADGVVIQVRHAAGSEPLAQAALEMMARVERLMAGDLLLKVRSGARLYIVELATFPPSFRIWEKGDPSFVSVFSVLASGLAAAAALPRVEDDAYSFLAHEWAHRSLDDVFGKRSPGLRARWVTEGFASYVEHASVQALMPGGLDHHLAERLPYLNLDQIDLRRLVRWKFPGPVPPREPMDEFFGRYGAAEAVFLRIQQRGGPRAVMAFLGRLTGRGRLREGEIDAALRATVGCDLPALARMSAEEKDAAHAEAVAALGSTEWKTQQFGLAVIERFPDRFTGHEIPLTSLVAGAQASEFIRARAAGIAMGQAPDGAAASLLERLNGVAAPPPDGVLLPVVLRLSKDSPACALEPLIRLAGSPDPEVSAPALARVRELAGRRMTLDRAGSWARTHPFGACPSRGDAEQAPGG